MHYKNCSKEPNGKDGFVKLFPHFCACVEVKGKIMNLKVMPKKSVHKAVDE
jgi:hypothetical protein